MLVSEKGGGQLSSSKTEVYKVKNHITLLKQSNKQVPLDPL